jgi:hypothetical protein
MESLIALEALRANPVTAITQNHYLVLSTQYLDIL